MKGIIFSSFQKSGDKKELIKNLSLLFFFSAVAAGVITGALSGKYADEGLMKSLDLIFLTNMQLRSGTGLFTASFAANFIFLLAVFLSGLTLWGEAAAVILPFIKGYGYGLMAGYIYSRYGISGIFYNLLIILPGAFIFAAVLSAAAREAFFNSVRITALFLKKPVNDDPAVQMKHYMMSMLWLLFLTAAASAADMLFSLGFSWIFGF